MRIKNLERGTWRKSKAYSLFNFPKKKGFHAAGYEPIGLDVRPGKQSSVDESGEQR
jgi:hypothetical protein